MKNIGLQKTMRWLESNKDKITAEWFDFLRFPSIGTDPAHLRDCADCAEWLAGRLAEIGFAVSFHGADSHPRILFAERKTDANAPTLLIYGHYDVQPADPAEAWQSPPFAPEIRDGRVFARGAQDNKGQIWWTLQAVKAAIESGADMPNIKIVLDGQEESGSAELVRLLGEKPCPIKPLRADVLLVADTGACSDGRPAITAGLRGVSSISFRLHGANHDLHSGTHGGVAPNPAAELAKIVASMFAEDGSVAVANFMDDVAAPTDAEIALALAMPFDAERYEASTGVAPVGGESGIAPQIRGALLPTIEINGFRSGYAGEGGKTIIPAFAEVKISCRTVPRQIPGKVIAAIRAHFVNRVKNGLRLEEIYAENGAAALRLGAGSEYAEIARAILDSADPRGSAVIYEGASIHVVGLLATAAEAEPLLVGFGQEADHIHAPDESYSFPQAEQNFRFAAELICEMGKKHHEP